MLCSAVRAALVVEPRSQIAFTGMTAIGASRPLPCAPAKVFLLNPQLSLGGRNRSSCPTSAIRDTRRDRLSWVESGHSATYPSWCTGARREADADAVEVDDLDRQVVALIRWSSSRAWMFGLGEWSPEKRASRSWPVIVSAAGLIQPKAAPAW